MGVARDHVMSILKKPSDRDLQISIGASNMSNGCTRCLAEQMVAGQQSVFGKYWLGARIGTAIHLDLEVNNPDPINVQGETKVVIGHIEGYGDVGSTSDAFFVQEGVVGDWKTTTKDKLKFIKWAIRDEPSEYEVTKVGEARAKVASYQRQVWLYGKGLENAGHTVKSCAIVFICRDGLTDDDIWEFEFPYDRERADAVFDRAVRLWEWLQVEGNTPDMLESDKYCYTCSVERGR